MNVVGSLSCQYKFQASTHKGNILAICCPCAVWKFILDLPKSSCLCMQATLFNNTATMKKMTVKNKSFINIFELNIMHWSHDWSELSWFTLRVTELLLPLPHVHKTPLHQCQQDRSLYISWMNNAFLISIQAVRTFDRRHSGVAAAGADVKYILLHVLKYAGWNPEDTDARAVFLTLFYPNISTVWKPLNGLPSIVAVWK